MLGPAQEQFIQQSVAGGARHYFAEGAVRGGKTAAAVTAFALFAIPLGGPFIIGARSAGAIRRTVIPELMKVCRSLGVPFAVHYGRNEATMGDCVLHLFGAPTEASQDAVQGMTAQGAFLDEMVLMPRSFVEQVKARLSMPGARLYGTMNPGPPTHYVKEEYLDRLDDIDGVAVQFGMADNPSLTPETIDAYERSFTGVFYRRYILGEWVAAEGSIFPHYRVGLPARPDRLRDWTNGADLGMGGTTASVLLGCDRPRAPREPPIEFVMGEYFHHAGSRGAMPAETHAVAMLALCGHFKVHAPFYVDPSATALRLALRNAGAMLREADNNVREGLIVMSGMFAREELIVSPSCKSLMRELDGYVWDEKAQERGEDKPLKRADHGVDALRYTIFSRNRFRHRLGRPIAKPRGF